MDEFVHSITTESKPGELHRTHYSERMEWEAESVATAILESAGLYESIYGTMPIDSRTADLNDALYDDRRWLL